MSEEIEIVSTVYHHPTITDGQHTNGPARIWIRVGEKWYPTGTSKRHKVAREIEANGPGRIMRGEWSEYPAQ